MKFLCSSKGRARTEGWVQSARPVGAVWALPGQRERAKKNRMWSVGGK
jgi:hypothetical protein